MSLWVSFLSRAFCLPFPQLSPKYVYSSLEIFGTKGNPGYFAYFRASLPRGRRLVKMTFQQRRLVWRCQVRVQKECTWGPSSFVSRGGCLVWNGAPSPSTPPAVTFSQ